MHKKKNFFEYIILHRKIIIQSFFISSIGLVIFLIQSFLGEEDYSSRIGLNSINITNKIFLVKYFILNLLRIEVLTFISICFVWLSHFRLEEFSS